MVGEKISQRQAKEARNKKRRRRMEHNQDVLRLIYKLIDNLVGMQILLHCRSSRQSTPFKSPTNNAQLYINCTIENNNISRCPHIIIFI
jgi:hypothetical protein